MPGSPGGFGPVVWGPRLMDDGRIAGVATARYARKKEAILAAATAVLNRQGVRGMTLADVAARVGLITTSVTYYYRKKDDLAAACFMRGLERFDAMISQAAAEPDPPARLLKFIDLYLDLNRRVRLGEATPLTSFTEIKALKEPMRTSVTDAFNDIFRRVRGFFEGQAFDHLEKRERNARTHLLLEQVFWSGTWLRRYDLDDYERVRDKIYDILAGGIAAPGRAWAPAALPDPTPLSADGLEWRETFLVAATRLINQRGYRGASVEDISAALNVTKGSFYHHHEDKDALVVECFQRTFAVTRKSQADAKALRSASSTSPCRPRPRPRLAAQTDNRTTDAVVAAARSALDKLLADAKATSALKDGKATIDVSGLDRRSLYAIASNKGGKFSIEEQVVASLQMKATATRPCRPRPRPCG
jgi:AcrR family transcriptional regulator